MNYQQITKYGQIGLIDRLILYLKRKSWIKLSKTIDLKGFEESEEED